MASNQMNESSDATLTAYSLDNLLNMANDAKNLLICSESPEYKITNYSIDSHLRGKLLRWILGILDIFSHDCLNPTKCSYVCSGDCLNRCDLRCSELCSKPGVVSTKTRELTFLIVDIFLSRNQIETTELQLLALSAFYLVFKIEEKFTLTIDEVLRLSDVSYSESELKSMEKQILSTVNWKLDYPTAGAIARELLLSFEIQKEIDFEWFSGQVDDYISFCLLELDISAFSFANIAIAGLLCAFENSDILPLGEKLVIEACKQLSLNIDNVRNCIKLLTTRILEYSSAIYKNPKNHCSTKAESEINDKNSGLGGLIVALSSCQEKEINTAIVCDDQLGIIDSSNAKILSERRESEVTETLESDDSPNKNLIADQDFTDQSMSMSFTISHIVLVKEEISESNFNQASHQ